MDEINTFGNTAVAGGELFKSNAFGDDIKKNEGRVYDMAVELLLATGDLCLR